MPALTAADIQNSMATYQQPKVCVGQVVRYYQFCAVNERDETFGIVSKIGRQSIDLWTPGLGRRGGVKHLTDPRLLGSPELRESGSWDYTEEHYAMDGLIEELMKIAFSATDDGNRKSPEKSSAAKELWQLRNDAAKLGAKNVKSMAKAELQAYIMQHGQQDAVPGSSEVATI